MDELTIQQARSGNRTAQAELLRHLQDVWFRMCVSLLRDQEMARDATQETALRFLRQLGEFRGESQLRTWSLGIAINVCREMRRRREGMRLVGEGGEEESGHAGPGREAEVAEARARVQAMVAELPERQREAVVLRFFEEMSVEEAAEAMGCAVGTVKATVHQALRALKAKLGALAP